MSLITAENIVKKFDGNTIVDNISLEIEAGKFVSIVGQSGSGKTTLISMLATFLPVTSGKIVVDGIDITKASKKEILYLRQRVIGYCYQSYNLIDELDVMTNILSPLTFSGAKADNELLDYLVTTLGLQNSLNKMPRTLSGGEAQRAAIARSLIKKPKVVFLDEPIGNLDSKNGDRVIQLLHRLNTDLKTTLIQVTHNILSTENTDVIELKDGKRFDGKI